MSRTPYLNQSMETVPPSFDSTICRLYLGLIPSGPKGFRKTACAHGVNVPAWKASGTLSTLESHWKYELACSTDSQMPAAALHYDIWEYRQSNCRVQA